MSRAVARQIRGHRANGEERPGFRFAYLGCATMRLNPSRGLLAPLYGSFSEGFDLPDLRDAKILLDQLAAAS
jgi:hypothetical protein